MDLKDFLEDSKRRVYGRMLSTNGRKYRWFISVMSLVKYAAPARGEVLEAVYLAFRDIDDIVDGDFSLPSSVNTREGYVQDRLRFVSTLSSPSEPPDYLMLHAFSLAEKLGFDIFSEVDDLLQSMLFDAKRVGKKQVFSASDLAHHFHLLDIRGTIRGALKIFEEDPSKYPLLEPLGKASRTYYDLRDFNADLRAGYVNISQEDMERHGISIANLESRLSLGVPAWFEEQASKGLDLLSQHDEMARVHQFGPIPSIGFPLIYAIPAGRFFRRVLREKEV